MMMLCELDRSHIAVIDWPLACYDLAVPVRDIDTMLTVAIRLQCIIIKGRYRADRENSS